MAKKEKIEKSVAKVILEKEGKVIISKREYNLAPPSMATLILVSELATDFPPIDKDADNVLYEVLRTAKDCKIVGKIIATLILGAKSIKENSRSRRKWWCWWRKNKPLEVDRLAEEILDECPPRDISEIFVNRLTALQISDFFGLTTSLSEVNLLRKTKEVED